MWTPSNILALLFLLVGGTAAIACDEPPAKPKTMVEQYKYGLLFEADGCKIYRFEDWNKHYIARCPEKVETHTSQSCGKNCSYDEVIEILKDMGKPEKIKD